MLTVTNWNACSSDGGCSQVFVSNLGFPHAHEKAQRQTLINVSTYIVEPVYAVHVLFSTTIIASSIAQSTQYYIIIIIIFNSLQETRYYLRCLDVVICDVCVDNSNINTTDYFTP